MVPNAKRPALAMLVGALWLTAADPAWAGSPGTNREQFVSLLANRNNLALVNQLQHQLTQITQVDNQLQQQQNALTSKVNVTSQSFNPLLVRLERLDHQFQLQSQRITQRLQKLNSLVANPAVNQKALDRLRTELTRLDTAVGTQLATIHRLERGSATPFAPGGF
jgi:hypothetical protein